MKIFTSSQVRLLDQLTIEQEPISPINLMERAADKLYEEYLREFLYHNPVCILSGPGNNGGDALALARLLLQTSLDVQVILLHTGKLSADCEANRLRLLETYPNALTEQTSTFIAPILSPKTVIVDGLFGSGLARPLDDLFADAVNWMNASGCSIASIDIPSGLQGEENSDLTTPIVKADSTYSFQFPKLAFLFPESALYAGKWSVLDISIHPQAIVETPNKYFYLTEEDIEPLIKKREKFSHKGTFGHALIVAGSKGMAGASVLASRAALRSGVGLVTVHGPECNREIVQTSIPEALFHSDVESDFISNLPDSLTNYNAVAFGPGIGTRAETAELLHYFLGHINSPCVLDADALNIISQKPELLTRIHENSILTPHPKEFDRLFGKSDSTYHRMLRASEEAQKLHIIIVLKGANTQIAMPDGTIYFNSTGNSGMATAGSGDVLSGILVALLAQGYAPEHAAKIGVYIHGLAGDIAFEKESLESMIASDIIQYLGKAFVRLKYKKKYFKHKMDRFVF